MTNGIVFPELLGSFKFEKNEMNLGEFKNMVNFWGIAPHREGNIWEFRKICENVPYVLWYGTYIPNFETFGHYLEMLDLGGTSQHLGVIEKFTKKLITYFLYCGTEHTY